MGKGRSGGALVVVGGVYREHCLRPAWQEVFGSGGRAASAVATMGVPIVLHTYVDPVGEAVLEARRAMEEFEVHATALARSISFEYDHGLSVPRVTGRGSPEEVLSVSSENVLRFGFMEGDAIVHADRVVYDPQDAIEPRPFHANGSTAGELALVLNRREATLLAGIDDPSAEELAEALVGDQGVTVVVIKQGPLGSLVHDGDQAVSVPCYRSESVWKIGSGDNFAAHFAFYWMYEKRSAVESADLASRATAYYCQTRGFPSVASLASFDPEPIKPSAAYLAGKRPVVYLAGPFFTLSQLWLVEQARSNLRAFGLDVFSPYHDVGLGSAEDVVSQDLEGIDGSDLVFAIADGMDSGTVFEAGYARALGKPVVVYCERESDEAKKMMRGSGCLLCDDYVSSIYETLWMACTLK